MLLFGFGIQTRLTASDSIYQSPGRAFGTRASQRSRHSATPITTRPFADRATIVREPLKPPMRAHRIDHLRRQAPAEAAWKRSCARPSLNPLSLALTSRPLLAIENPRARNQRDWPSLASEGAFF